MQIRARAAPSHFPLDKAPGPSPSNSRSSGPRALARTTQAEQRRPPRRAETVHQRLLPMPFLIAPVCSQGCRQARCASGPALRSGLQDQFRCARTGPSAGIVFTRLSRERSWHVRQTQGNLAAISHHESCCCLQRPWLRNRGTCQRRRSRLRRRARQQGPASRCRSRPPRRRE
jgi:hypothetical protein